MVRAFSADHGSARWTGSGTLEVSPEWSGGTSAAKRQHFRRVLRVPLPVDLTPKGFAPRTPQHALSRAASPACSVRVGSLARSLAFNLLRRTSPLGLSNTLSRAPLRRLAPFAGLTRDSPTPSPEP